MRVMDVVILRWDSSLQFTDSCAAGPSRNCSVDSTSSSISVEKTLISALPDRVSGAPNIQLSRLSGWAA